MPRILRTLLILLIIPTLLVWLIFGLPYAKADEDGAKNARRAPVQQAPVSVESIDARTTHPNEAG